jgi:Divergent InlB B-repeat domain
VSILSGMAGGRTRWLAALAGAAALAALNAGGGLAAPVPTTWCGGDQSAADRLPDAVAGRQVHVIYAIPSDGFDRFGALASAIATDVATIDAWWRREDPARTLRFDVFAFSGCGSPLGALDLSFARLPGDTALYEPFAGRYNRLEADLLRTYDDPGKKYLVYYDGRVEGANVCGTSRSAQPLDGALFSIVYPNVDRCGTVGAADYNAKVAAHELLHGLGAVPRGAPHLCPDQTAHTCDNGNDIMHGGGTLQNSIFDMVLDVDRDDYYGHVGTWWDVQDSPWLHRLDRPQHQLTVALRGTPKSSRVTSTAPGLDCPSACSIAWDEGETVVLDATVADGLRVVSWGGACSGNASTCEVEMDAAKSVSVLFGPAFFTARLLIAGSGRIAGGGVTCVRSCARPFDAGQTVVFRATPAKGSRFVRWEGACRARLPCRVRLDRARTVRAVFARR